jgi:SAM-dependent methyltransferase
MVASAYDEIGVGYAAHRRPDPSIQAAIWRVIADRTVANVGAGTGSYEPAGTVVAVEPSAVMIAQRPAGSAPVVQGIAEALPLSTDSVDACLAVLTVHHWGDPLLGLTEMLRASRGPVVIVTWDQRALQNLWLYRYFPAAIALDAARWTDVTALAGALDTEATVAPLLVPRDCKDGFAAAYWARPAAYLDPNVRASISSLVRLPASVVDRGVAELRRDLASRKWDEDNADLSGLEMFDAGYRLITLSPL